MTNKPLILDTYCKAGGASMGYHRAGFEVVGVDIEPQKRYPFEFHCWDAIEFILKHGKDFDVIAGSPPCQLYSVTASLSSGNHPDLVEPTREAMIKTGKPYIIENVPGAPLINPIKLCGTMFDLRVIRHRLFECNPVVWFPPRQCQHVGRANGCRGKNGTLEEFEYLTVVGGHAKVSDARTAMDIDWMTSKELDQAIPPAYTEWLGKEMRRLLNI